MIPTRDRPDYVRRAVASALSQSVQDVEVLVVDDASATPIVFDDPRVRVFSLGRRVGVAAARNVGLRAARGEWVVFLDDDDELMSDMIEASLAAAETSTLPQPVAVLSCSRVVDETGAVVDKRCPPETLPRGSRWFLSGGGEGGFRCERTMLAPIEPVLAVGGFDERFDAMEDKDFFLRLNAVCSIQGLHRETYVKWEHDGPRLLSDALARAEGIRLTLDKHGDEISTDRRKHARLLGSMAMGYLIAGRRRRAISAGFAAIARDPTQPRLYALAFATLAGRRALALGTRIRARRGMRRRPVEA